ncbi:filamentous hemagglutinin N-terminal domain-containing protein, partial [Polynucleobacter paneuropaeus]
MSKKHAHRNDGHGVSVRKTVMASVFLSATLLTVPSAFAAPAANALPTNGQVVAGQANISQTGNVMNINQSTQRAVINWDSFNVGKNATVNFNQPNSGASTLNRVNGASQSMINGAVNANGQVIFVNPNGVVFGKGAEVNTGGLVATTMNIKDSDYMSGKMSFSGGESGKVINKGTITAHGINGYIALMAPEVKNQGVLIANISNSNTIALVSGTKVTLSFDGSQLTNITVDASAINSLITNKHAITTNGGQIIIAANAASNLKASVINNTGTISADTVSTVGGKVFLTAGTVNQSGTVSANSAESDGGNVTISGNQVNLNTASKTSATGATAGGQILLGKTAKNIAQSQVNANAVTVAEGAVVDASATQNGNGGSIEVWSTISTSVAGMFKANGGALGGNGGTIDTSSAGVVTYGKGLVVDTTAPKGKTGNWLTDPLSIIIDSTAATILSDALMTTNVTLDATASSCAGIGNCTTSSVPLIQFLAGTSVYSTANTALTLNAPGGTITMDGSIAVGQVYAVAQTINVNGSLNTTSGSNGSIYLAGAIINILGNINSNGNSSNNSSSSNLTSANTITANNRRNGVNGINSQSNLTNALNADDTTYTSNGGAINIIASGDIHIGSSSISSVTNNSSYISANGQSGGTINIVSVNGNINNQGIVDALGKSATGGSVIIVAKNTNTFTSALISSDGYTQAGVIQIGVANGIGSGSTLAPPSINSQVATLLAAVNFTPSSSSSILTSNTSLDNATVITANSAASTSQVTLNSQAGQIYIAGNNSLNTAATIQANADTGGLIILSSPAGNYQNTGYIQTNGGAGLGGTIAQSGLISTTLIGATVEANGTLGGGNIIIGRDFQASPLSGSATQAALLPSLSSVITLPTSASTTIDANSSLSANSTQSGDGGNVLVWGDANLVAGALSAQAMGASGNGGFIETSGQTLNVANSVNISSASSNGLAGTWLLDPYDLTVASSGGDVTGSTIQTALGTTSVTLTAGSSSVSSSGATLTGSGTSSSSGNIYIYDTISWSGAYTLTLNAYNNIYVGSSTVAGSLTLTGTSVLVMRACGGNSSCTSNPAANASYGVGYVLMGMAGSPTSGLIAGYQNGFNGQINVSSSATNPININGYNYTVINSVAALNAITTNSAVQNNNGTATNKGYFVLGSDITSALTTSIIPTTYSIYFSGYFNGFGHTINVALTNGNMGLFSEADFFTFSNLGVKGSITSSTAGQYLGAIVSYVPGGVNVNDGTILNTYNAANITYSGNGPHIGGIIGSGNFETLINVYNAGSITVTSGTWGSNAGYVAGLVSGGNTTIATNVYNTGAINLSGLTVSGVGGLFGFLGGSNGGTITGGSIITNAYNTGNITVGPNSIAIGGIFAIENWGPSKFTNIYSSGSITAGAGSTVVGVIGGLYFDDPAKNMASTFYNSTNASSVGGATITNAFGTVWTSVGLVNKLNCSGICINGSPSGTTYYSVSPLTTTQMTVSSNFTGFTFSSSAWGYSSVVNSSPILCQFGGCTINDTYIGSSGGTWSTASNWSLGLAPLSSNTSSYTNIIINSGSTVYLDTANVGSLTATIANAGIISFTGSSSVTLSGVISGAGALKTDSSYAGTVTLSGTNTYTGVTTISGGTLSVSTLANGGSSSNLGASTNAAANLVLDGGTLKYTGAAVSTDRLFTLTNSGGTIDASGTGALTFTNSGSIAYTGTSTRTLTLAGTSTNNNTLSQVLANNTGLTSLAKSGAGTWILSGTNTYTGGTTISAGTLVASTSASALGSGAVTLGASSGNTSATLQVATTGLTYSNAIVLSAGTSGTLTIGNTGTAISTTFSGGVTGTNNLVISEGATNGTITFATGSLNNIGTITNSGSGTGTTTISGAIGSNVTGITESSSTSALTISGAITTAGTTFTNSGTNVLTISNNISGTGNVIFNNNSSGTTTVSGTSINNIGTITNSGSGTGTTTISGAIGSNVTGITESSSTSALTISGAITTAGTTFTNSGTNVLTISNNISGTGNVIFNNNSSGTTTVSGTSINNIGTITNSGSGTGTTTISGAIGSNVTGITESSSTSALTLSGTNTYTGGTTITAGTINAGSGNALGTGGVGIGSSGILNLTYSGTVTLGSTLSMSTGASITNSANTSSLSVAGASTLNGSITTTGTQTYTGAVTLGANAALTTTNSNITFSSTVDSTAGSYYGLSITNGTGTTALGGVVGANSATSALGYLCINATGCSASAVGTTTGNGTTTLAGSVTTSGTQTYGGNLFLYGSAGINLTSTNSPVTVAGNISTDIHILQLLGAGAYISNGVTYANTGGASYTNLVLSNNNGLLTWNGTNYSWAPSTQISSLSASLLLVAGGGSGGTYGGGGGGGGGIIYVSSFSLGTATSYSTTIGAGGINSNGGNTLFGSTYTAIGGGEGGGYNSAGNSGGAGGGGAFNSSGGAGTSGQGNAGGSGVSGGTSNGGNGGTGNDLAGGGGGTADGANHAGSGGNGFYTNISGTYTYYAGGGGGSNATSTYNASGGFGGGGTGAAGGSTGMTAGTSNTGGGGGGQYTGSSGANGGSGIVIINTLGPALTINSGTGKSSIGGTVSNVTTLTINSTAATSAVTGSIGGSTAVAYNTASGYTGSNGAAGVLSLAGTNTYTGGTTVTGGTLQAGSVAAFGGATSAITVNSGAALDLNGKTLTYANALTLNGTGISSAGALTNSSSTAATYAGAITLGSDSTMGSTAGAITVTGAIGSTASAYKLALVGSKAITLSSATNTLSTIASGSGLGALSITNNQALTIGSMAIGDTTYSGLSSTGTILVQTITGNLTVNNAVITTSTSAVTSAPAIKLAAGYNDATTSTTNNIILGSSSSNWITAGSGAIIALYSGTPLSSTNLSVFVAGQSASYTSYGVTTTTGSLGSGAGYYALYRSTQPNLYVIYGSSDTPTYGSAPTITYTFNTLANGTGTSYLSTDTATVNATGTALFKGTNTTTSASNVSLNSSANAGSYTTVTYLSGLSSPIYALSAGFSTGTLKVNQA